MEHERRQIQLFVKGGLAAWGEVDEDALQRNKTTLVNLRTNGAHDRYGIFEGCSVVIEDNPRHFHDSAGT